MSQTVKIHHKISEIPVEKWNALLSDGNPFIRHEFLNALEVYDCATPRFGWQACHIAVYRDDELVGAMPLYLKNNSYGEFVFDHLWADFYQQKNTEYFPKLVASEPYTPATGDRLLSHLPSDEIYPVLLSAVFQLAKSTNASGFHCLFPSEKNYDWLSVNAPMIRAGFQFHWHNQDYQDFDHFLTELKPKKRKNIRY